MRRVQITLEELDNETCEVLPSREELAVMDTGFANPGFASAAYADSNMPVPPVIHNDPITIDYQPPVIHQPVVFQPIGYDYGGSTHPYDQQHCDWNTGNMDHKGGDWNTDKPDNTDWNNQGNQGDYRYYQNVPGNQVTPYTYNYNTSPTNYSTWQQPTDLNTPYTWGGTNTWNTTTPGTYTYNQGMNYPGMNYPTYA